MSRPRAGAVAIAALAASLALAATPAVAAKKKGGGKKNPKVDVTRAINAAVPDKGPAATDPAGILRDTITVGKKFKGQVIKDVDVTVQTTGDVVGASEDVFVQLSAPNGASSLLFVSLEGQSVGPLTLDDDTATAILNGGPCVVPGWLCQPYAGRARPGNYQIPAPLWPMDGGPARGAWTLRVWDFGSMGTSVVNLWRLQVVTGRPFAEQ
jgi:subtilisin-like proprotein convertase family protein